jgi:cryptochrome 1
VWFRRDLRLEDNPALIAAARAGTVIPVFVWSPAEDGQFHPGRVSRWWLKQSLIHLDLSLKKLGSPLVMRKSPDTLAVLLEIAEATGATQVFYNHLYGECYSETISLSSIWMVQKIPGH